MYNTMQDPILAALEAEMNNRDPMKEMIAQLKSEKAPHAGAESTRSSDELADLVNGLEDDDVDYKRIAEEVRAMQEANVFDGADDYEDIIRGMQKSQRADVLIDINEDPVELPANQSASKNPVQGTTVFGLVCSLLNSAFTVAALCLNWATKKITQAPQQNEPQQNEYNGR